MKNSNLMSVLVVILLIVFICRAETATAPKLPVNKANKPTVVAGMPAVTPKRAIIKAQTPLPKKAATFKTPPSPELSREALQKEIQNEEYDEPIEQAEQEIIKFPAKPQEQKTGLVTEVPIAKKEGFVYLGEYLAPWKGKEGDEKISMQFENADLLYLIEYLSKTFNVTFILNDNFSPAPGPKVANNKITFKTQVPIPKRQVWEIGLTFLDMAGLAAVPADQPRTYRVMASSSDQNKPSANREPLPTFIGVDPALVPNSELKIRYVYFVENAEIGVLKSIIDAMRSPSSAPALVVEPMRALIMTDKAANIRSLLNIIVELDAVTMPETLSVIKLKHADAGRVVELYKQLITPGDQQPNYLFRPARKTETTTYFTKNTRVIAEPRSNSLIVLGTREGIKRFEDFVLSVVDKAVDLPFSPLHIHQLRYLQADAIAAIINDVIKFQPNEPAAQYGGVRGGEKYFKIGTMVTPEKSGNRLIINSTYDDYLKILEILETMDVEQPQVAIKVLVLNVDLTDTRALGTQLRNAFCTTPNPADIPAGTPVCGQNFCCGPAILNPNINFQTSGLGFDGATGSGIVENDTNTNVGSGSIRLLGNLIALAQGQPVGTTLISLGQDMFGIFGILRTLQTFTRTTVIANPFVMATHKYKATISVGQTRRLTSAIVSGVGGNITGFTDVDANLEVQFIPQISYNDELIQLEILFSLIQFTDVQGDRTAKQIRTQTILANGEVLALGGLIMDTVTDAVSKVPILGDIPILGYFFKNKIKVLTRSAIVVLISPEIIRPHSQVEADSYTQSKINNYKEVLYDMRDFSETRDPFTRWFFREEPEKQTAELDKFVSTQGRYLDEIRRLEAESQLGGAVPPLIALNQTSQAPQEQQEKVAKKGLLDLVGSKPQAEAKVDGVKA